MLPSLLCAFKLGKDILLPIAVNLKIIWGFSIEYLRQRANSSIKYYVNYKKVTLNRKAEVGKTPGEKESEDDKFRLRQNEAHMAQQTDLT